MMGSRNTPNGLCYRNQNKSSRIHTGHGVCNFIFHGWKVIESKFGVMEKNLLSENKKAEKVQTLKKYQTDFNFS